MFKYAKFVCCIIPTSRSKKTSRYVLYVCVLFLRNKQLEKRIDQPLQIKQIIENKALCTYGEEEKSIIYSFRIAEA